MTNAQLLRTVLKLLLEPVKGADKRIYVQLLGLV